MNRDDTKKLCAELDRVLTKEGMTLPEIMEQLTESFNKNPAVVGRGIFRLNGTEAFTAYAERCQSKNHIYQKVAEALDVGGFPSRIGLRENKELGQIFPLIWMARR